MLDGENKSRLLQHYPVLRGVKPAVFDEIFAGAAFIRAPEGTVIFDENQPCQGFPLLLSGCIRVIKAAASGRELQLYRVGPGESCILTSSCLLGHASYPARGIVEEDAELIALPAQAFKKLLDGHAPFRDYVFGLFAERLSDLMQLVSAVAFQKLDQRLAALLVSKPSPLNTTHQALADELGSVREIISRLLKHFAEQGWVKLSREQIEVIHPEELKKLSASH